MTADVSTTPGVGKSCAEVLRGGTRPTPAQPGATLLARADGERTSGEVPAFFNKLKDMVRGTRVEGKRAHRRVCSDQHAGGKERV